MFNYTPYKKDKDFCPHPSLNVPVYKAYHELFPTAAQKSKEKRGKKEDSITMSPFFYPEYKESEIS